MLRFLEPRGPCPGVRLLYFSKDTHPKQQKAVHGKSARVSRDAEAAKLFSYANLLRLYRKGFRT